MHAEVRFLSSAVTDANETRLLVRLASSVGVCVSGPPNGRAFSRSRFPEADRVHDATALRLSVGQANGAAGTIYYPLDLHQHQHQGLRSLGRPDGPADDGCPRGRRAHSSSDRKQPPHDLSSSGYGDRSASVPQSKASAAFGVSRDRQLHALAVLPGELREPERQPQRRRQLVGRARRARRARCCRARRYRASCPGAASGPHRRNAQPSSWTEAHALFVEAESWATSGPCYISVPIFITEGDIHKKEVVVTDAAEAQRQRQATTRCARGCWASSTR